LQQTFESFSWDDDGATRCQTTNGLLETQAVQSYRFTHQGVNFVLIDTPGFDDSRGLDRQIVMDILSWLESSYQQGTKLNGVLYFHRIIDPRMSGTALSNLRLFRSLCGSDNLANVILGTTFWDTVDDAVGQRRENEFRTNPQYWKMLVEKGSRLVRVQQDRASNLQILTDIARNNGKFVTQAQKEMLAGKAMSETTAAQSMNAEIEALRQENEARLVAERRRLEEVQRQAELKRKQWRKEQEHREQERRLAQQKAAEEQARRHRQRQEQAEKERQAELKRLQEEKEAMLRRAEEIKRQKAREEEQRQQRRQRRAFYQTYRCQETYSLSGQVMCDKCSRIIRAGGSYYYRTY